ncbi:hypothetical protein PV396_21250 [Streptomyces sp. ME02-8801-2C]|nr:hypothetical protein [Streptomyces sp. ME02-8801-2C]MDX3454441.1 hypothetical protein [Streptomyces sp. ME02-8801-2C]
MTTPAPGPAPEEQPRYESGPTPGKVLAWVLLFMVAAVVVVVGGVYFG